jgi:hypothetical protein
MALPAAVLPRRRPAPYGPGVPRAPKNFRIDMLHVEEMPPSGYVRSGPDTAVLTHFQAGFALGIPQVSGKIEVILIDGLRPSVIELSIRSRAQDPVNSTMLRQILVDQILQAAMEKAAIPLAEYEEWLKKSRNGRTLEPWPREAPGGGTPTSRELARRRADEDARKAAQVYAEAVASGSRAPAVAVSETMNRSRAQVARYIRRAREMGLLSPLA